MEGKYAHLTHKVIAYNEADKAKEDSSTFSRKFTYDINDTTFYLMGISDNHSNLDALVYSLNNASYLSNMGVIFLGDQGKVSIPDSKTPSAEAKPVQVEIDTMLYAIDASEINVEKQLLAYLDGNHEDRVKKHSSIEIGKSITSALGIPERYAGNTALLTLNLNDPLKPGKKITVTGFLSHGQGRGGGPGAEADKSLNSKFVKGVNFVAQGDTHKVINANKIFDEYDPGVKGKISKEKMFVNFGTDLSQEEYLLERGIAPRAVRDGEILRISIVPNAEKTNSEVVIDYVNIRQVLSENTKKAINKLKRNLTHAENLEYKSLQEVNKAYTNLAKFENLEKIDLQKRYNTTKTAKYPKVLRIVPLSGFNIGSDETENEAGIDAMIKQISMLDDDSCKVILNGDMIYYKKANLLERVNYPEDTFTFLQTLAQKLEPIKSKIIAYNSGVNEAAIMKLTGNASKHAQELAKIAMKTIQLDKNLAYEPYDQKKLRAEKLKVQNKHVEQFNEAVLAKEYKKFAYNFDKIDTLAEYKKQTIDGNLEPLTDEERKTAYAWNQTQIEEIIVHKLRAEGKLLDGSTEKGRKKINRQFPLSEIELEQPHHNLVQNILCKLMGINPKQISINSDLTQTCDNHVKILNAKNEVQGINIVTSYKKGNKARKSIEKMLTDIHNGAEIHVSNGEEYTTKEREGIVDSQGNLHVQDIIHISGGRLDNPNSANRIYEIRSEQVARKRITSGLFEDTNNTTLTCSSISYKTILKDNYLQDVSNMYENLLKESYMKTINKTQEKIVNEKTQKTVQNFSSILSKDFKGGKE